MFSMNYCKFENLFLELSSVLDRLNDFEELSLSNTEAKYCALVIKTCRSISGDYGEDEEDEILRDYENLDY